MPQRHRRGKEGGFRVGLKVFVWVWIGQREVSLDAIGPIGSGALSSQASSHKNFMAQSL